MSNPILITGGAGFIGANFVHRWIEAKRAPVVVLDKLTYAGNPANLAQHAEKREFKLIVGDIGDRTIVRNVLAMHTPIAIVNFAAESHVDRSIHGPAEFIETNVVGTFNLLDEARAYWEGLPEPARASFRFLHVSTDEVYGSLGPDEAPFTELSPYAPNSPYSASKASSDHLVRAFHHTYGFPTLTTNCSNNYGPYQFPEKLIPLLIQRATEGKPIPVYGDGLNVRDWLYVEDHCDAIMTVLERGQLGEVYNVGGNCEMPNIELVRTVCRVLDDMASDSPTRPHEALITYVRDRPGHDRRYAIDNSKIAAQLGWRPRMKFEDGIKRTVRWYLDNKDWTRSVTSGEYRNWIAKNYERRDS